MKSIMRLILLGACLATFASGASFGMDFELAAGPGMSYKSNSKTFGLVIAPGLQQSVSSRTDIGLVFAAGFFTKPGVNQFSASFQLRYKLDEKLGFLIGLGGGVNPHDHWDVFLYPTVGLTYELSRSTLEMRYSPGSNDPYLHDRDLLWVGWRFPFGGLKGSAEANPGSDVPGSTGL